MSDLYTDRIENCRKHQKTAVKINKWFRISFYFSAAQSALTILWFLLIVVIGLMTAGHAAYLSVTGFFSAMCSCGIIIYGALTAENKKKRMILYEVLLIFARTVLNSISSPGGAALQFILGTVSVILWLSCWKMCEKWEYLRQQEGFPDFNPLAIQNENSVANTAGKGISKVKNAPTDSGGYMDEIETSDLFNDEQ